MDIEFIAQYLMLRHAADHPDIVSPNTSNALARLVKAGLLDAECGAELRAALSLWQRLQGVLRLSAVGAFDSGNATEGQRNLLVKAGQAADFDDLVRNMDAAAGRVLDHFDRLVAIPGTAA